MTMGCPMLKLIIVLLLFTRCKTQGTCEPKDCIVSEWNNWEDCTQTCGENGTRQRLKTLFRVASCGGTCSDQLEETEPCNIKCCPKDCMYTGWSKWGLCFCDEDGCEGGGARYNCHRTRVKIEDRECGGYCDDVTSQQQCGNLCCYENCVVSAWSFWGICQAQCEQMGTMVRKRHITQEPRCHGKQCGALEEEKQCIGECCPVDCVLGEWSTWSKCNVTCGESVETRTRFVRLPDCNGERCPETPDERQTRPCSQYNNVDCVVAPWSLWTECILDNGFCGQGVKTRSRTVETHPECNGKTCGNLTESGICYGQCCIQDCIVNDWTTWSHCSTSCGQGISNRTRKIEHLPSCGGSPCTDKLLDKRDCVVRDELDCEFTIWSTWTACSTDCGTGVQGRTRTLITPAYCGGKCENEATEEEIECENYEAKQDCEVSEWTEWGRCVRNCGRGDQTRNRTIIVNPVCSGTVCPTDLVNHRSCHEPCEQLCNLGVCSCNLGYRLQSDNITCSEVVCPIPKVSYCPANHRELVDCRHPYFRCTEGYKYNKSCAPYCSPSEWTLKGAPLTVTCQNDGTWSQPEIFCARPNKPPTGIEIDTTIIEENKPKDFCFAYLSTTTDDEEYEIHTYTIIQDITDRFYIRDNRLCLARSPDFEETPSKWNVTFRSTDIEGEYVQKVIEFEIKNANDPPTSVKVEPNTIPENSPPETVVGCLSASDDDQGQNVTLTLVDSYQETFATFLDGDKLCIKVVADSDPRCSTDGGTFCKLNMEEDAVHFITILAMDDGTPPMSAYYDIPVVLTNVNDRQTSVGIEPKLIPEEIEPGLPLVQLNTIDEDDHQQYTYTLLDDSDGLFTISGDNLTSTRKFDFESEAGEVFAITVESTDDDDVNPLKVSKRIVMQISDVNESPFDLQLTSVGGILNFDVNQPKIKENIPTAIIGTLSVKDADALDEVKVEFVNGMDAEGRLTLFNMRCSTLSTVNVYCSAILVLMGSLNYETEDHVNISLSATDKLGETTFLNLSIEVLDMNDPPSKILYDGKEKEYLKIEESQQDFKICELSAVDEDVNVAHTFELIDSSSGLFIVENNVLKTTKDSVLDYEVSDEHEIKLKCTDSGEPPLSSVFDVTVKVVDVNEAPSATTLSNNSIRENSAEETLVGKFTTVDPDNEVEERQSFRYSLPDDAKGRFKLDGNKLVVKQSNRICGNKPCALDFELEPMLYLTVLTMDNGSPRLQRQDTFVLQVENTNDPPTDVKVTNNVVNENQPPRTAVGKVLAFDQDGEETLSYALKSHEDLFGLEEGNTLVTKAVLDYEYLPSYRIRISVTDDGSPPAESEETIVIQVLNVNEPPVINNVDETLVVRDDVEPNNPAAAIEISDPDSRETITVMINDPTDAFSVDEPICNTIPSTGATDCTVNLVPNIVLDVNVADVYQIELIVQDKKGLTSSHAVTVTVIDVNNAPSNILVNSLNNSTFHISEDANISAIALFKAIDADIGQTFQYRITDDPSGLLEMSGNILQSKASLDFESDIKSISFVIEVQDSGSPVKSLNKSFILVVDDVNEPPSNLTLSKANVEENSVEGAMIGYFEVEDQDNNQEYTIVLLDSLKGLFVVKNNNLMIGEDGCYENRKRYCRLDYEKQKKITLSLSVKDDGSPSKTAQFNININIIDVNEAPRDIQLQGNKVIIGSSSGTIIGKLTATDDDDDQGYTFQLDDNKDKFNIDASNNLLVKDTASLNEGDVLYITVTVTDNGSPPASSHGIVPVTVKGSENVTISLTSDGVSTDFPLNKATIKENTDVGVVIASVIAETPKEEIAFTVALRSGSDHLQVGSTECSYDNSRSVCRADLLISSLIDYENNTTIDVLIESTVDNGKQYLDHFEIVITDQNEAPDDIIFSGVINGVHENSQNEFIGTFKATDPDASDKHTYTLEGTDDLVLHSNGSLVSASDASIDFETINQIEVVIKTTDSGGLWFNKTFTINVLDVNEKPTGLSISSNKIPEMSAIGTAVGKLQVDDPDKDQVFSFNIVAGDDDAVFEISEFELKVSREGVNCAHAGNTECALDYESKSLYTLTIKVTDNGTPTLSGVFTLNITIEDANDKPGPMQLSSSKVYENTPSGTVVANVTSVDKDKDQKLTFTLNKTDMFYILNGNLVVNGTLNFEAQSTYTLQVEVKDDGDPVLSEISTIIIEVIDINETPEKLMFAHTVDSSIAFKDDQPQIKENVPPSSYIGQVKVLDPDSSEDITLQILSSDLMVLNKDCIPLTKGTRCTWDVSTTRSFDFEKENNTSFDVIGTDSSGLQIRKTFLLEILDTNDAPTDILFLVDNEHANVLKIQENSLGVLVAVLSAEDEESDQTNIYDVVDSTKSLYITNNELRVTSAANLDYERQQQFSVTVKVTDSGSPALSFEKQVPVQVIDINEAPTSAVLTNDDVFENATVGDTVGTINVQDPDNIKRDRQTFTITITNDDSPFTIEANTLVVANAELIHSTYAVHINVTDSGTPALSKSFQFLVTILDVNDPPVKLDFTGKTIQENLEVGAIVGELLGRDYDVGQTLMYSIVNSDALSINDSHVVVNGLIDYEAEDEILFTARVTDDGDPPLSLESSFIVKVEDINEGPISLNIIDNLEMTISEGALLDEKVAAVEVIDGDKSEIYEGNITDGREMFKLSPSGFVCGSSTTAPYKIQVTRCTIDLLLNSLFDYETMTEPVSVTLSVRDKGGLELKQMFTFIVTNENEPPRDILLDTELTSIPENTDDFVVGGLSTLDEDRSDTHSFQVVKYWEYFTIIGNKLYVRTPLDYEAQRSYNVSIKTTDNGTPALSFTKELVLNVSDVNEAPSSIKLSHNEVEIGAEQGTTIGFITVLDPDNLEGSGILQTHECSLTPGDLFTLDPEDAILVKTLIPATVQSANITVKCMDSGKPPLSYSQDFQILVVENVNAPKGILLMTDDGVVDITIDENVSDIHLGSFSVVNLLSGNPDSGSYIFLLENSEDVGLTILGTNLQLTQPLDYESTPMIEYTVQAMGVDSGGNQLTLNQIFKISVNDINEAPTDIWIYGDKSVDENSPSGSIIGDLITIDPEDDQTYSYKLLGVNYGFNASSGDTDLLDVFSLDGKTLKVGIKAEALNYETSAIITLLVQSTDSGDIPYSVEALLHLQILNKNDPPTGIKLSNSVVSEDSPVNTLVGSIIVDDEDVGQENRCEILNIIDVPFKVTNRTEVIVDQKLDFESHKSYNVKISCGDTVPDGTRLKLSKTLLINVSNVNEAPTEIQLTVTEIQEANLIGQIVGEIKVIDLDSSKTFISLLKENDWESFGIEGDSTLVANAIFDFEERSFLTLMINATDDAGAFTTKSFEIQVTDVNEAPSSISLENQEVLEDKRPGDVVGKFITVDPDINQKWVYTLDADTLNAGTFEIKDSSLRVGLAGLDYETQHQHVISVTSTDDGIPPQFIQVNFTIDVIDTNDPPSDIITAQIEATPESTPIHSVIATVQVDDPDVNQSHSCQLNDTQHMTLATRDGDAIEMILLQPLNFEVTSVLYLNISCSDGEFEISRVIILNIGDVNEPPTSIELSGSQTVRASAKPGHVIGQLTVEDDDVGQTHTITVVGQNSDLISISSNNELILKNAIPSVQIEQLDPSLQFSLTVADNGDPVLTYNQSFAIPITDADILTFGIPKLSIDNNTIREYSKAKTMVGQLFFIEQTTLDTLLISIEENFENAFAIENATYLVFARDFTNTDASSVAIVVKVTDTKTQEFTLNKITIFIERTCSTNQTVCSATETCVSHNDTHSQCECQSDFQRDGNNVCSAIDNCLSGSEVLCQNGGTCIDDVNTFVCQCRAGFAGESCEINNNEDNPCTDNDCKNGGICILDIDEGTYNCSCNVGWEGTRCQLSKDDCGNGVCYNGGSCIDKHLAYLCDCVTGYKGLRCQYELDICSEQYCNSTHLCVGKTLSKDTLCVSEDSYKVDLTYDRPSDVNNIDVFLARLEDFILRYGRLSTVMSPSIRKKRGTELNEAQMYVVDAVQLDNDKFKFSFVILNEAGEPFTRIDVLSVLSITCTKINSGDLNETTFCPPIINAARKPALQPEESSSSIGIIAGVIGALVVIIIVIVVVIVLYKKKDNSVRPEGVEAATESRRSSGYSSLTKAGRPLPVPNISKNQVAPQPMDDTSASSVSQLNPVYEP